MRTPLLSFCLAAILGAGCIEDVIDEATAPHTDPGGSVVAGLSVGEMRTTTALANHTVTPMTIQGASSQLTFSLTASDSTGGTADTDLTTPPAASTLRIYAGGRNALEVHLDGDGCVAATGTVSLSINSSYQISGTFDADGTISNGSDACHISGSLTNVPEMH